MKSESQFSQEFEEIRLWIKSAVTAFADDSEAAKAARIARARTDKKYFAQTYYPHYCEDDFAPIHGEMFKVADTYNRPVVIGGAREIAKSTIISFFDEMHKTLFKINRFTVFICDTQETAISEFLLPIRAELEENQRIINDFGDQKTKYWDMKDFVTKNGKRFLALGPKMGAKGKKHRNQRPDRIICEDMENRNSSKKRSIIKRRIKWLLGDVMKSVSFKKWQFLFIGNYDSKKTIIHYLLNSEETKHWLRKLFPAMREVKGKLKSVWESRMPTKKLLQEQEDDPVTFRTERLLKAEDEEAVFKEEWIQYFKDEDIAGLPLVVVTYKDPSALSGEEHCFKAIIVLAVDPVDMIYYVIHAWIKKTSKWNGVKAHFTLSKQYDSVVDGIESNGYQSTLKEDYELVEKERGETLNLKMVNHRMPKEVRISRRASLVQRGKVKFKRKHSDQQELIDQLIDFPDGDFIDGPDALDGAIELIESKVLKIKKKVTADVLG